MTTLKTTTFDRQREQNNQSLQKAGYVVDLSLEALPRRRSGRIIVLLDKRAELELLASTQNQRELYGIERWHSDFVRPREVRVPPAAAADREELWTQLWRLIPDSRFRRFQEIFSQPHSRIVPSFGIDAHGRAGFKRAPDFQRLPVKGCLVSADLLPEQLAEDLRLTVFTEEDRRQPVQRLAKKADERVVEGLKLIWDGTWQLQKGNLRLLMIRPPSEEVRSRYPGAAPLDPQIIGAVLYTREESVAREGGRGPVPKKRMVQFFDSAYAACRKTAHESRLYREEVAKLAELQKELEAFRRRLDVEWRTVSAAEKQQLQSEAAPVIDKALKTLRACENRFKIEAFDFLNRVGPLTDRSGKVNPTVAMTLMTSSDRRLDQRFEDICPKAGFNEQDALVLRRQIERHEQDIRLFCAALRKNAGVLEQNVAPLSAGPLSAAQVQAAAAGLRARLGFYPAMLQEVKLRPFTVFADRLREKYAEFEQALLSRDGEAAKDAVIKMHVIGKFHAVNACFERMREWMLEALPLSKIRGFADEMQKIIFDTYQVFPARIVEEYREPFDKLQAGLDGLRERLAQYAEQDLDVSCRTRIYRQVKKYLDSVDVVGEAGKLP